MEFVFLLISFYNEDKEGDRMKKRNLMFSLVLSISLCGCQNSQNETDRTIKRIDDSHYSMSITELSGLEALDRHTRLTQMNDDRLYFITDTTFGNTDRNDFYADENTPQNSFVTKAIYAYNQKQSTLETILEGDDEKAYYDYQMFQGNSYAVVKTLHEDDSPDDQLQLTENGTSILTWKQENYHPGFYLHTYRDKLYLLQYSMGNYVMPELYEVRGKEPLKIVRNAFMTRLKELSGSNETAPQIHMYGKKAAYLFQKEKTMELGIYDNRKFHQYEIPFIGEILAIFGNDVLFQTEDGACYWNLKQNQCKAVKSSEFKTELAHEFLQINEHQLLYTSMHTMKLFTYRDDGTYLLQDITDRPYHIELVHGNQILFSNSSADSIHFYLGTLKD